MYKAWRKRILILLLPVFCYISTACQTHTQPRDDILRVAVTIPPLAEFVEQVGKEQVQITIMVPPGVSPHTYEPVPSQLALLASTDLYVKVGTPIEFELVWLDKLTAMNKTMHICNASDNINLIPQNDNGNGPAGIDPHIWLSVRNACTMVSNISRALSLIDPEHQYTYAENARRYCARLDSLDKAISAMLIHKQKRTFIVYHSAWNYFARDYDLEQRTIEVGGKEPSAKIIQNIIEVARQQNIHVLFASPQFDHKYAEAIARDINGQVILVDPLAKNYIENIGNISTSLVRYLE